MMVLLCFLFFFVDAATIQWSGRGGTNLWDNANNWDCGCLPTANDDVQIAFSLGSTAVRIGAPARARTLTIGGPNTQFSQSLTVSGTLSITGGTLNPNGALFIETSSLNPFNISGIFTVNSVGLIFTSGLIGGTGTLEVTPGASLNFSGPAAKEISGNVRIDGASQITSSTGSSIFVRDKGTFTVTGELDCRTALSVNVDPQASFNIMSNATFTFAGGSGAKLLLNGNYFLGNWKVVAGAVTVVNQLQSGTLTMDAASSLTLIGAPTESRVFNSITGGSVVQSGGNSSFGNINVALMDLQGGNATFTSSAVIANLQLNGATILGGSITASSGTIVFAIISGRTQVTASSLDLRGIVTLQDDGSSLIIPPSGQMRVSLPSQVTFLGATTLMIQNNAQVSQGNTLKLVKASADGPNPMVSQNGLWTTSYPLTSLGVPVMGSGSFSLSTSGSLDWTNANFSTTSFASSGVFSFLSGNINIATATGTGRYMGSPAVFTSTTFAAGNFTLTDGTATISKATISSVTLINGQLSVSNGQFSGMALQGGIFSGVNSMSTASVTTLNVTGVPAKTVQNLALTVTNLNLACGPSQCALFTINATITTK